VRVQICVCVCVCARVGGESPRQARCAARSPRLQEERAEALAAKAEVRAAKCSTAVRAAVQLLRVCDTRVCMTRAKAEVGPHAQ
jgi:hypothetical protein